MNAFIAWWRAFWFRRKFDRCGAGCRFLGKYVEVKGHVELGDKCAIGQNVVLRTHKNGRLVFGNEVEICDNVIIQCNDTLEVGDGARIGEFCVIRDSHHVVYGTELHWRISPHNTAPIHIGPGSYIGAHAYLGPGIRVGEGAVIAPGSVLTRSTGPYEVWAGRPARRIADARTGEITTRLRQHVDLISMFGFALPEEPEAAASAEDAGNAGG